MFGSYLHSFALENGRKVFVPSPQGRDAGDQIQRNLRARWRIPSYFYHLRRGGHIAAVGHHLHDHVFATLDISGFFDSVTRTKAYRALRGLGLDHEEAWEMACQSCVEKTHGKRDFSIPCGFPQSPLVASIALDRSALGRAMNRIVRSRHARLSCYVDDIIFSGREQEAVESARRELIVGARLSNFVFNAEKSQAPGPSVEVFNINLTHRSMSLTDERMRGFEEVVRTGQSTAATRAVLAYVRSVNTSQADQLETLGHVP